MERLRDALRATDGRALVAVHHSLENVEKAIKLVDLAREVHQERDARTEEPFTVGLELARFNIRWYLNGLVPSEPSFFMELLDHCIERGIPVAALDNKFLRGKFASDYGDPKPFNLAVSVILGDATKSTFHGLIASANAFIDSHKDDKVMSTRMYDGFIQAHDTVSLLTEALRLLATTDVQGDWDRINARREEIMLRRIRRQRIHVPIVGAQHGNAMRSKLPSHKFVTIEYDPITMFEPVSDSSFSY